MKDARTKEQKRIDTRFADHWLRFLKLTGVEDGTPSVFLELHKAYGGPDRHYHAKKHIVDGLDLLQAARKARPDWFAVPWTNAQIELAFWDHDIVYVPGSRQNELASGIAGYAHGVKLGFPRLVAQNVGRDIQATDHKQKPEGLSAGIVCDIDLSSLAAPWEEFCENTRKIHREFSQYDTPTFMAGQRAYLAKLRDNRADRNIYWTDYFRDKFEAQAQENLDRFIGGDFHEG